MTTTTDPQPLRPSDAPTEASPADDRPGHGPSPVDPFDPRHLGVHHSHHFHAPSPGGSLVAGLAVYEVAAVSINSALELDVLPTITGAVRHFRWSRLFGTLAGLGVLVTMWALVATAAAALAGLSARPRRR